MGGGERGSAGRGGAVADLPLASRAETLLGDLLVGDRTRSRDLRVPAGAGPADVRRLRHRCPAYRRPAVPAADLCGRVARRHIPDYLLVTGAGPVVVDVKPRARHEDPVIALTLAWTRSMVVGRGWRFEVSASHRRRSWRTSGSWPATAGTGCSTRACSMRCGRGTWTGSRWVTACRCLPARSAPLVRAAVLHLLWRQELVTDLGRPLSAGQLLRRARVTGATVRVGVGTRFIYDGELAEVVDMAATTGGHRGGAEGRPGAGRSGGPRSGNCSPRPGPGWSRMRPAHRPPTWKCPPAPP